jgi:peroxiredoxin
MEIILLVARIILALVFGVAGIAKLFDRKGSKRAIYDFGVPDSLVTPVSIALPMVEIVVAIALLPAATVWYGAVGAVILLGLFVGGIAYNMAQGKTPDCHCFGQIHSEPVGWSTLIRNSALLVIAGMVAVFGYQNPGLSAVAWLFDLTKAETMILIFGLMTVGLLFFAVGLLNEVLKRQVTIQRQIELLEIANQEGNIIHERADAAPPSDGLPIGAPAPDFSWPDINGKQVSLDNLLDLGKTLVLFFVSPTCHPCRALLPEIREWQEKYGDKFTFAFVSEGSVEENKAKIAGNGEQILLIQQNRQTSESFRAKWTPTAVVINQDGVIASLLATGDVAVRQLVEKITGQQTEEIVPPNGNGHGHEHITISDLIRKTVPNIGQPAPPLILPDVQGKTVDLSQFRGDKTLLLFWSLTCGYCQKMLGDLRKWDANPNKTKLIVVSSGDVEENKKISIKSPVVIADENYEAAQPFGMIGTPSAVLIDERGKIASSVAVGATDIFALLGK